MRNVNVKESLHGLKEKVMQYMHRDASAKEDEQQPQVQPQQAEAVVNWITRPQQEGVLSKEERWSRNSQTGTENNFAGRIPYQYQEEKTPQHMPPQETQANQPQPNAQPMQEVQAQYTQPNPQGMNGGYAQPPVPMQPVFCAVVSITGFDSCRTLIEQMRAEQELIITLEMMDDEKLVQQCINTLAGAAFALNVALQRISFTLPIYLIASNRIQYSYDQALLQRVQQMYDNGYNQAYNMLNQTAPQRPIYPYMQQQTMQMPAQPYMQQPMQAPMQPQPMAAQDYMNNRGRVNVRNMQPSAQNAQPGNPPVQPYGMPSSDRVQAEPGSMTGRFMRNSNQPGSVAEMVNGRRR